MKKVQFREATRILLKDITRRGPEGTPYHISICKKCYLLYYFSILSPMFAASNCPKYYYIHTNIPSDAKCTFGHKHNKKILTQTLINLSQKKIRFFWPFTLHFFLKIGKWIRTCSGSSYFQCCLVQSSVFGFDIFWSFDSSPTFQSSTQH